MTDLHCIGWAVKQMWNGDRVRRRGWNGKGMFLFLWPAGKTDIFADTLGRVECQPFVSMFTAQGTFVPWLCSQSDLLATDWEIAI